MNMFVTRNGKEEKLAIKSIGWFKPKQIWLGDEMLGLMPSQSQLRKGVILKAVDGSELSIKLTTFPAQLLFMFNGSPVRGSASDPNEQIKAAYYLMMFICALNFLLGSIAYFGEVPALLNVGFGFYNLIIGTLYLVLLYIGYDAKMFVPLVVGLIIFCADALMMLNVMIQLKQPNPGPIIVRIFFIIGWAKGCIAARKQGH
ncbi:MAG: hypothetical protein NDI63_08670 [Pseudobdellovibrio sp.]|nr:hypothetical protein [Pseudobdellovibrio sp.]